ncbi:MULTISPECIES: hypothetical protein [Bacillus]|uniref:hypothetical protein n=2 Tax=Bacillus TaxID=1386 RepID=UPI0003E24A38|nr:hypothetical protein [Bacillus cereus]ETT88886.1 hypothetical protein C175_00235 [Bacillus cereus]OOR38534.1 hypothetical protein BW895_21560 [Bacillus cereus]
MYLDMHPVKKISNVIVRFANEKDQLEIKVHVNHHCYKEANIQIDQQLLIDKGVMKRRGALKQAQNWLQKHKRFVVLSIIEQLPEFFGGDWKIWLEQENQTK